MTTENVCVIGPCECGGYGVIYNDEWKTKLGKCHDALEDLPPKKESNLHPVFEQALAPFTAHMDDMGHDVEANPDNDCHDCGEDTCVCDQ